MEKVKLNHLTTEHYKTQDWSKSCYKILEHASSHPNPLFLTYVAFTDKVISNEAKNNVSIIKTKGTVPTKQITRIRPLYPNDDLQPNPNLQNNKLSSC